MYVSRLTFHVLQEYFLDCHTALRKNDSFVKATAHKRATFATHWYRCQAGDAVTVRRMLCMLAW